jgi:hypothetical protein
MNEILLILLISFLLITIVIIVIMMLQKNERKDTGSTMKVLPNSLVYNKHIANSIKDAKNSIYIYFQMLRPSKAGKFPNLINSALKERIEKGDIEIYILTAKEYDRIAGAYELNDILLNSKVYFSDKLRMTDFRYTLIDKNKAIIGLNKAGELLSAKYNPSDTWVEITSLKLGEILAKNYFETKTNSSSYDEYMSDVVERYTDGKKENIPIASQQLNVPIKEISNYFKEISTFSDNTTNMENKKFDVFMAYNVKDKQAIIKIYNLLRSKNINPWLDKKQLPPGRWFQDIMQTAVDNVKTAAIFIGINGLGKWEELELRAFISKCVEENIPVIPVLLPTVSNIPRNLLFLKELNLVHFKTNDDPEALENLIWGITAK